MEKYLNLLTEIPLFENINSENIQFMLNCLQVQKKNYKKEMFIRNEGDRADFIGIVLIGSIRILQYDYHGKRTITASFSAGEMFAEAISCADIPTLPFSIQAASDCEILFLNKDQLLQQCNGRCEFHNRLIQNLLKIVSLKNMLINHKLRYLSQKTTAEKLLSFLADQAQLHHSKEFTIPYDRQALADYLGVDRSTISTEISKLQKQGIIESKRSFFKINI